MLKAEPKKSIKNVFKNLFLSVIYYFYLKIAKSILPFKQMLFQMKKYVCLLKNVRNFVSQVHGTLPIEKAFITGGGVSIKEVEPKTMSSKLKEGLYFCGEILDIHGYTGGFNITAAFVTGRLAGINAAQYSKQ